MIEDKPKPRKGPAPGYKAPIKYRGPNGETWTGRGKMPLWMVDAGGDKEQFKLSAQQRMEEAAIASAMPKLKAQIEEDIITAMVKDGE